MMYPPVKKYEFLDPVQDVAASAPVPTSPSWTAIPMTPPTWKMMLAKEPPTPANSRGNAWMMDVLE